MIITLDGPAGSGKSTIARLLGEKLGIPVIYSGLFYRALASYIFKKNEGSKTQLQPITDDYLEDISGIKNVEISEDNRVYVEGLEITSILRTTEVDDLSSKISQTKTVRDKVAELIRAATFNLTSFIAEGRDMGSVVFKNAEVKLYLDASLSERARRRYLEILREGCISFEEVLEDIKKRDEIDSHRELSPLAIPVGAHCLDTSNMEIQEIIEAIMLILSSTSFGESNF